MSGLNTNNEPDENERLYKNSTLGDYMNCIVAMSKKPSGYCIFPYLKVRAQQILYHLNSCYPECVRQC